MSDKTGGTAFPTSTWDNEFDKVVDQTKGMTLLDYFAAKALAGLLPARDELGRTAFTEMAPSVVAENAYEIAEAMLAEREKRNG